MTSPEHDVAVPPSPMPSGLLLSEPVRAYVYGAAAVIAAGLLLAGYVTDEWSTFALAAVAQLLMIPAGALARANVYSQGTMSLTARRVGRAIEEETRDAYLAARIADQLDPIGRHAA